jgi:hypothetical protein
MSNAGIPLRVIQQVSGHRTLTELQKYLEVSDAQVRGAVSALSMLSYGGKPHFPHLSPYNRYSFIKNYHFYKRIHEQTQVLGR